MGSGKSETYISLGRLGAPYGVKGWLKLVSFTDPPANILQHRHFMIRTARGLQQIEMDKSRAHGKGFIGHVVGCDVREQCRELTGKELLIDQADLPALEQGTYYWHQLTGLKVVNRQLEQLGVVSSLMETGAHDVLVVKAGADSIDENERLIPYVMGQFVLSIDLDAGLIEVDWPADY